jgi:hypothetical protein
MSYRYLIVLDLSLNETGYAVFDTNLKKPLISWGAIKNHHFETGQEGQKLKHIEMILITLQMNYFPAKVLIEEWLSVANSSGSVNKQVGYKTSYQLGGVHGIAKKVFSGYEIEYANNKTVKKYFTSNGDAKKEDIIARCNEEEVINKLVMAGPKKCYHIANDNEADSIAMGCYHLGILRHPDFKENKK